MDHWFTFVFLLDFSQLRICRPPPHSLLRSGHIYMKDGHSAEPNENSYFYFLSYGWLYLQFTATQEVCQRPNKMLFKSDQIYRKDAFLVHSRFCIWLILYTRGVSPTKKWCNQPYHCQINTHPSCIFGHIWTTFFLAGGRNCKSEKSEIWFFIRFSTVGIFHVNMATSENMGRGREGKAYPNLGQCLSLYMDHWFNSLWIR